MPYPVAFRKICGNQIIRAEKERWLDSLPHAKRKKVAMDRNAKGDTSIELVTRVPGTHVH